MRCGDRSLHQGVRTQAPDLFGAEPFFVQIGLALGQRPGGRAQPVAISRDGTEIYYASTNSSSILAAEVDVESFSAAEPREVSTVPRRRASGMDVTADGQRFLVITDPAIAAGEGTGERINVVLNWFEELKGGYRTDGNDAHHATFGLT